MAKLFKVIMNILIIVFIASLVALFVPPLLGITTVVADSDSATNMQVGSVAYGSRVSLDDLAIGDTIISNSDNETYLYEVTAIDTSTGVLSVKSSDTSDVKNITLRRTASKKLFVIPFIGYIVIALQSTEGLIILGLGVVLLVILFIISEILCRKSQKIDDEEDAEVDREYFRNLATSQQKPSALDELGTITIPPIKDIMDEENNSTPSDTVPLDEELENPELILEPADNLDDEDEADKADEQYEDSSNDEEFLDDEPSFKAKDVSTQNKAKKKTIKELIQGEETSDDAHSEGSSKKSFDLPSINNTSELSDIGNALENVLENERMNQTPHSEEPSPAPIPEENDVTDIPASEIEIAIPARSLEELLQEAYAKGEDPTVIKDEAIGVTLVDYSDCLK